MLPPPDMPALAEDLNQFGCATLPGLLSAEDCAALAAMYPETTPFRSHIHMARHGFGRGEYKYFAYPLPDRVAQLRQALYPRLVDIANDWNARMGLETRFPADHADYLGQCHAAGQVRPTPLLLEYGAGDFNCLH